MFISVVGGTGKYILIETISALVASIWPDHNLMCAITAPTSLASFIIRGVSVHRLFILPVEHEGRTTGYWSLSKDAQKTVKTLLRQVKVFIVDEVSMFSRLNLAYLHLRLEELFGSDEWFGGKNMLFGHSTTTQSTNLGRLVPVHPWVSGLCVQMGSQTVVVQQLL